MKKNILSVFLILSGFLVLSCTDNKTAEDQDLSDSHAEESDSNDEDYDNESDIRPDQESDAETDEAGDSGNDSAPDPENDAEGDLEPDIEPDIEPDVENSDDEVEIPSGTTGYEIELPEGGIYKKGFFFTADVMGDQVDFYVPLSSKDKMSTVIYLQGAKVDKGFYSIFAKTVSSYGFVVAIPNHSSFSGENMTENKVFTQSWEYIKAQNLKSASYLYNRIETAKVTVMGHSLGGVAALGVLQNKCEMPTCTGSYTHPPELAAAVFYGTNTKNPYLGGIAEVNTGGIPVSFVQGSVDGKAKYEDAVGTYDKTEGTPVSIVKVLGANHYGICDFNNPIGAAEDSSLPFLDQTLGLSVIAKWSGIFLRAHIYGETEWSDYFYKGQGDSEDVNVEIISK
ncbi:MAG TPA: hypothetical protein P5044_02200 [bacterium]|nr:hypothetical protein [bacterium]